MEPVRYQVVTIRDGNRMVRATWLTKETAEAIEAELSAIFSHTQVVIEVMPDQPSDPDERSR